MGHVIDFNKKKPEKECSFCKKTKFLAPFLLKGIGEVYICADCVEKCNKLIAEDIDEGETSET